MKPLITVLMSVYNDEKYLEKSIESIINQSFTSFEFIIIDDASTDNSIEIIRKYRERDNRIQLIENKINKGLSHNLAEGVNLANSNYVARMDSDDIAFPDRLKIQFEYIEQFNDVDIVGSYVIDIDDQGFEQSLRKVPTTHERIAKLIWTCPFIHPTVLFKKESIINVGSYNKHLRRRQDYDLWFRCHESNLKFANIDEPLLYYRVTDEYFKKNNIRVQFQQAKMGFMGSKRVNASLIAYIGVTVALVKGILPNFIRKPLNQILIKVDPRRA